MKNRRVLVTGASRGIGRAIAVRLAQDGFDIVAHFHRSEGAANELVDEIAAEGGTVSLCRFDVADRSACERELGALVESEGPFFGIVSNAGIVRDALFDELTGEQWDAVLRTNLDSFYNVMKPLVQPMVTSRVKGRVVTIASISGLVGNRAQVNYSAAKAGIIGATKALAQEVARRGITVNCVAPGLIKTDMVAGLPLEQIVQRIPMRRLGKPQEVAGVVSFLFSPDAAYVTGQVVSVNGGMI